MGKRGCHGRCAPWVLVSLLLPITLAGRGAGGGMATAPTPAPDCAPQRDNLIVPGCRIGSIALGMDPGDVFKALGSPAPTSCTSRALEVQFNPKEGSRVNGMYVKAER